MKGKRVIELLNEITSEEHRTLILFCRESKDKRLQILYKVLKNKIKYLDDFSNLLAIETKHQFKDKNNLEIDHICRRNLDYYATVIENIIIQSHVTADQKLRNIIIAESLEKTSNPFLLEYYYEKAYQQAHLLSDSYIEIKAIRGKIRLKFNAQTEKSFREAVVLNNQLKNDIDFFYHEKNVDYYNNLSNMYIDSHLLINIDKEKLSTELENLKDQCNFIALKIGYIISLARLSFKDDNYFKHINAAYELLNESNSIELINKNILERKILFLELIIGFYFNKNQHSLFVTINRILTINLENKFIDNNTMFHYLLLLVLNEKTEDAIFILNKEKHYFKGTNKALKEFIFSLVYYKENQLKKCLKIINNLSYSENYFIALFSKLFCIKIHIELKNIELSNSLIYNTERFIKRNSDKFTVYDSSLFIISRFKEKTKHKTLPKSTFNTPSLSPFHLFLLQ